ncbi:uncharacterized protein LOC110849902 [Folsomia candida]|nr:uncharacterized protein LOC110849902 [Folsomia candida]
MPDDSLNLFEIGNMFHGDELDALRPYLDRLLSPIENASPSTSQDDQAKNYNGQIATISSGAILNAAAKATLTTVGFKSTGIAATSIASGWQSWVGVGSVFSYLQSAGTLGWFSLGPGSLVGGVLGVVGVGNWWWNRNNDKEPAPKDN